MTRSTTRSPILSFLLATTLLATTLLAALFVAAPALAQPGHGPGHGPGHHGAHDGGHHGPGPFFGADADGDGAVSQSELDATLSRIDSDADGVLSHDELRAHHRDVRSAEAEDAEDAEDGARPGRRGPRQRMMRHMMSVLDTDGDGAIQTAEVQAHFAELDANDDGLVSAEERPCPRCGMRQHLLGAAALRGADADKSGDVTLSEWNAFLATLDATFERLDENGDGVISSDELPRPRHPRHGR